jgi:hypothetical protein
VNVDDEILNLAEQMERLLPRFRQSSSDGMFLATEDQALFKRLALEAKGAIDVALGRPNDFSGNLIQTVNDGSGGFFGGPSYAAVSEAAQILKGAVNQKRRQTFASANNTTRKPAYVDLNQIDELRKLKNKQWDFSRLAQLCIELNAAHEHDSYLTIAMLVRAITDHVPPIFAQPHFQGVASNYAGTRSFKNSMKHLDGSLRNIADSALHTQIRQSESVPGPTQVNFGADLAVLLEEVIRISR